MSEVARAARAGSVDGSSLELEDASLREEALTACISTSPVESTGQGVENDGKREIGGGEEEDEGGGGSRPKGQYLHFYLGKAGKNLIVQYSSYGKGPEGQE